LLRSLAAAVLQALCRVSRAILAALLAPFLRTPILAALLSAALAKLFLPLPGPPFLTLLLLAALLKRSLSALASTLLRP
jgi:hypothetical protein